MNRRAWLELSHDSRSELKPNLGGQVEVLENSI